MKGHPKSGKVGTIKLASSESERRDNFIAAALTGMLASGETKGFQDIVSRAIAFADEVIRQAPNPIEDEHEG